MSTSALKPDNDVSIDVDNATAQARAVAPEFGGLVPARRAEFLDAIADALDKEVEDLIAIADEETSLGEARLRGEVARTSGQLRLFGQVLREGSYLEATIDHADDSLTPPKPDLRRQLVPLGPVAVFTASNFPFAFSVAGGDTASALAAGCPVVVKGHSGHPRLSRRTAAVVQAALRSAGAPDGIVTHVEGRAAGRALVSDPTIRAVGFTGSLSGGRALFDLAVSRPEPIPFYGELSSLNPVVLTRGAVRARSTEIAQGLAASFTLGVGQFCTKPGLVFVPDGEDLETPLRSVVAGTEPAPMLNPRLVDSFETGIADLRSIDSVEVIIPPAADVPDGCAAAQVYAISAERLLDAPDDVVEERFGPAVVLVRYTDLEQLSQAIQVLPGSLTASVHAEADELDDLAPILGQLEDLSGRVIYDGWPTGVAVTWAMQHGGPWPSTTNPLHTSVGTSAIRRFLRPLAFQNADHGRLPPALQDDNPLSVPRRIDGVLQLP